AAQQGTCRLGPSRCAGVCRAKLCDGDFGPGAVRGRKREYLRALATTEASRSSWCGRSTQLSTRSLQFVRHAVDLARELARRAPPGSRVRGCEEPVKRLRLVRHAVDLNGAVVPNAPPPRTESDLDRVAWLPGGAYIGGHPNVVRQWRLSVRVAQPHV